MSLEAVPADVPTVENSGSQWAGEFDPLAEDEERRVLFGALDSFKQFRKSAHYNVTHRRRQNFYALPSSHWQRLAEAPFKYLETLELVDNAIDANAIVAEEILTCGLRDFGLPSEPEKGSVNDWRQRSSSSDTSKALSTLRQLYRDWSVEGNRERQIIYDPLFRDLEELSSQARGPFTKVLVPGAGLGRLVFDLCLRGYSVEGNEISYHQLLASSWILNNTNASEQFELYPFVVQFTNNLSREHQLQRVSIPDIHPGTAIAHRLQNGGEVGEMNMTAADFLVLYNSPEQARAFDVVITVFFIDTAPNLIRYIECIRNCLRTGGYWLNIGPLLWHFDDRAPVEQAGPHTRKQPKDLEGIAEPGSFELTDTEVIALVEQFDFRVTKHEILDQMVGYIQDPNSMLQNLYKMSHWVAVKC